MNVFLHGSFVAVSLSPKNNRRRQRKLYGQTYLEIWVRVSMNIS